jgi:hypothetical protein
MNPPSDAPSLTAAHALWVELVTRISSQHLHLRSGLEETAAESIYGIFKTTRELMAKHPGAADFLHVAERLLNGLLRPHTARWHGWMAEDRELRDSQGKPVLRFRDEWVRRQFRRELQGLQRRIATFVDVLGRLKDGGTLDDGDRSQLDAAIVGQPSSPMPTTTKASLGADLPTGLRIQGKMQWPTCVAPGRNLAWRLYHSKCRWLVRALTWLWMGEEREARIRRELDGPLMPITDEAQRKASVFADRINQAETEELLARRRALGITPNDVLKDATGLAFSGGGIRSATFCLGIAQVLARRGLLPQFDYLSTVSGGGYLGAFLSSYLGTGERELPAKSEREEAEARLDETFGPKDRPPKAATNETEKPADAPREPRALRHLRNRSRYLLDGELWDKITQIGMVAAGVLFNLLMVLPLPLIAALATCALHSMEGPSFGWEWVRGENSVAPMNSWFGWTLGGAAGVLIVSALVYPDLKRRAEAELRTQGRSAALKTWTRVFRIGLATTTFLLLVWLLPVGFRAYHWLWNLNPKGWLGELSDKVGIEKLVTGLATATSAILGYLASRRTAKTQGGGGRGWRVLAFLSGPLLYLFVYFSTGYRLMFAPEEFQWSALWVGGVVIALLVWAWGFVDVNTYSPHGYYRDRLCDCYLQTRAKADPEKDPHRPTVPVPAPKLRLSELGACKVAPYHLINATLNLPSSEELELRGRSGDFFLFSKHFCGSPLVGYHPTKALEAVDPHLDLGTAMAVAGAAASSNMGWKTINGLRLIMTLANVRLGYWLKNPALGEATAKTLFRPGPSYLFREMFAQGMNEQQPYLNLSDGGHIENLAVYELLRRRCKFIVCVDGGMEPGMECEDLIRLERYAAIDLGIRMHYDVADLKLQANGYSRTYGVLVKIDYAPPGSEAARHARSPETAEWGWMLYLKLAMVGYGPGYVMDYKRQNPDFPHQTTGDQLFDEAQFEAYRALGAAAAESFFTSEVIGEEAKVELRGWFQALASNLLPDNDEVFRPKAQA